MIKTITCDICSAEIDVSTEYHITLLLSNNGEMIKRVDWCSKCANKALNLRCDDAEEE